MTVKKKSVYYQLSYNEVPYGRKYDSLPDADKAFNNELGISKVNGIVKTTIKEELVYWVSEDRKTEFFGNGIGEED